MSNELTLGQISTAKEYLLKAEVIYDDCSDFHYECGECRTQYGYEPSDEYVYNILGILKAIDIHKYRLSYKQQVDESGESKPGLDEYFNWEDYVNDCSDKKQLTLAVRLYLDEEFKIQDEYLSVEFLHLLERNSRGVKREDNTKTRFTPEIMEKLLSEEYVSKITDMLLLGDKNETVWKYTVSDTLSYMFSGDEVTLTDGVDKFNIAFDEFYGVQIVEGYSTEEIYGDKLLSIVLDEKASVLESYEYGLDDDGYYFIACGGCGWMHFSKELNCYITGAYGGVSPFTPLNKLTGHIDMDGKIVNLADGSVDIIPLDVELLPYDGTIRERIIYKMHAMSPHDAETHPALNVPIKNSELLEAVSPIQKELDESQRHRDLIPTQQHLIELARDIKALPIVAAALQLELDKE